MFFIAERIDVLGLHNPVLFKPFQCPYPDCFQLTEAYEAAGKQPLI